MSEGNLKTIKKRVSDQTSSNDYQDIIPHLGDINMRLNSDRVIIEINVAPNGQIQEISNWENKDINDFLTIESKEKLELQLSNIFALGKKTTGPFELNHTSLETGQFPVKYKGFRTKSSNEVLLVGTDLTPIAEIQKSFVNSQLALEREYSRFRSFETKFKAISDFTEDAILLINLSTGIVEDANIKSIHFLNLKREKLLGQKVDKVFYTKESFNLIELLKANTEQEFKTKLYFGHGLKNREINSNCLSFRAGNDWCMLLRLQDREKNTELEKEFPSTLKKFYENSRSGIVFTNEAGVIKYANPSFLEICNVGKEDISLGRQFSDFLKRGIVDNNVLIEAALANGTTMPLSTQLLSPFSRPIDVEISATKASSQFGQFICFFIVENPKNIDEHEDNMVVSEKATQNIMKLVGSAPLKELVADTNDIVEKICIETALKMTKNNRVATAEMLNLSRQSLYVKLRKYSLL